MTKTGLFDTFIEEPTLQRFDLGMKRMALITGGGGLFDFPSRACLFVGFFNDNMKLHRTSWVRISQGVF